MFFFTLSALPEVNMRTILPALLLLSACSDYSLNETKEAQNGYDPRIEVEPLLLSFESDTLNSSELKTFVVSNTGYGSLNISDLSLTGDSTFSLLSVGSTHNLLTPYKTATHGPQDL